MNIPSSGSFERRYPALGIVLCLASTLFMVGIIGLVLAALFSCGASKPILAIEPLDQIREPLARIPVRQEVIKQAAPDNPVVLTQADATKGDAKAASAAVTAAESAHSRQAQDQAAQIAQLRADLAEAKSDAGKKGAMWMWRLRILCSIGIGGGIALCFLLDRKFIIITVAAIATLGGIAIDGFVWTYGMPIAAGSLGVLILIGLWYLRVHRGAVRTIATVGDPNTRNLPERTVKLLQRYTPNVTPATPGP